jgi:hypothetical protein
VYICLVKLESVCNFLQRHCLGLDNKPRALKDMLSTQDGPSVRSLANPRVVWRNRDITNAPAQRRILSDTKCRPEDDLIIDEDHGHMTVEPGESVIFLSNGRVSPSLIFQTDEVSVSDKIVIELAVLRGIASGSEGAIGFYSWLRTVVDHACSERRVSGSYIYFFRDKTDDFIAESSWYNGTGRLEHGTPSCS